MPSIPKIDTVTRKQISAFTPAALSKAIDSYQRFTDHKVECDFDSQPFREHHNAAKVAIAHVTLLLHLASWAFETDDAQAEQGLADMIAAAQAELAGRDHAGQ